MPASHIKTNTFSRPLDVWDNFHDTFSDNVAYKIVYLINSNVGVKIGGCNIYKDKCLLVLPSSFILSFWSPVYSEVLFFTIT